MAGHVRVRLFRTILALLLLAAASAAQSTKLSGFFPPPPFPAGDVEEFRISPDGAWIVYRADQEQADRIELYSRPLDLSRPAVELNGPLVPDFLGRAEVSLFAISPDGQWVVYAAPRITDADDLFVVPIDGSAEPVHISGLPASSRFEVYFARDSSRFVVNAVQVARPWLHTVPIDGSAPAAPLHPEVLGEQKLLQWIELTPDSSRVLFAIFSVAEDEANAFSASLAGGSLRYLGAGSLDAKVLPDSTSFVYTTSVGIFRAAVDGSGTPLFLGPTGAPTEGIECTPDGSRVLYRRYEMAGNELFSVRTDGSEPPVRVGPPSTGSSLVNDYVVTPDGSHVAMRFSPDGFGGGLLRYRLYYAPVDGGSPAVDLTASMPPNRTVEQFVITPDSTRIVFHADAEVLNRKELFSISLQAPYGGTKLNGELVEGGDVDRSPFAGGERVFELSADGARVVYRADQEEDQTFELFSVPVDGGAEPVKLNQPFGTSGRTQDFRVSPAGDYVVYVAALDQDQVLELFRVAIDGSDERRRVNGSLARGPSRADVTEYEVDPTGAYAVFLADAKTDEQFELHSVRLDDAQTLVRLNDQPPPGSDVRNFRISPDGTWVVYDVARELSPFDTTLFAVPIDRTSEPRRVSPLSLGRVFDFAITSDGERVVFRATAAQSIELFSAPIRGDQNSTRLSPPLVTGGAVQEFLISADGTRVVYLADQETNNIEELYSVSARGGPVSRLNAPLAGFGILDFTLGPLTLDPAASRVVYLGDQDTPGQLELFSSRLDGSAPPVKLSHPLEPLGDVERDFQVSSDGLWVAYAADDDVNGTLRLYGVPTDGSLPAVELNAPFPPGGELPSQFPQYRFRITADGTRVVYVADQDVDTVVELFVVPVDGGADPLKLSAPLPGQDDVSSDYGPFAIGPAGEWVVYATRTSFGPPTRLFGVPLDGSREAVPLSGMGDARPYALTPDERRVVFIAGDADGSFQLYAVPVGGERSPTRLNGALVPFGTVFSFRVTPASDRVVYLADQDTDGVDELYTSPVRTTPARRR